MITREDSLRIKGVTILFMIAFHLFGFPQRLPIDGSAWMGSPIIKALQICVPYFYFYQDMDYKALLITPILAFLLF